MAIVDTVWGRLTRFNPPDSDFAGSPARPRQRFPLLSAIAALRWIVVGVVLALVSWAALAEMRTSHLQALLFSRLARGLTFDVKDGPSETVKFPTAGPYDRRLGYVDLPGFIASLTKRGFAVESQARWSPGMSKFVRQGGFPIYDEKDRTGLRVFDRSGGQLYQAKTPEHVYPDFDSIPDLAVRTLLFVEDRYLLDPDNPERNPAVEWDRFGWAAAVRVAGLVVPGLHAGGGSTLATQLEKFRHSPGGMTGGVGEKLRQMMTAAARAYSDGTDTRARREAIVTAYLNSTPLAAMPGFGEVIGFPEALWIWFGTDPEQAAKILGETPRGAAALARQGEVYRQVLALVLSGRRPSYYLLEDREALGALIDKYLPALANAGVIGPGLRDAALAAKLRFRTEPPQAASSVSYVQRKATEEVRNRLVGLLHLPDLYVLDRLDLTVDTAVDTATQGRVAAVLERLSDPQFLRAQGMVGKQLVSGGDPSKIAWSFVLYERGEQRNHLRVHADSLNRPFDINSGSKLQLGSTAKLRTLVTYLEIVAELHQQLSPLPARELSRLAASADDALSGWAASYLARARDRSLQPMLDAALQRRYSAAPDRFFTGGGTQSFANFATWEDHVNPTVAEAFEQSINLSFVRLLRDVVNYYAATSGVEMKRLLSNPDDPGREVYLQRFVDEDSRRFLSRFYNDYKGLSSDEALDRLAGQIRPEPRKLAAVYLTLHPKARIAEFYRFLAARMPNLDLTAEQVWDNYLSYAPDRMSLKDRGYIAGVHPLELWLVRYLQTHPDASWDAVMQDSAEVRQQAYEWLLNGSTYKQNLRIRIMIERDAFGRLLDNWRSVGFPFGHLVPSLGTAIGASGDRPQALSELMGIILNDGVRLPTASIERLRFASNTPYETNLEPASRGEQVMPVEVARTVRRALTEVVTAGTARRINGVYKEADGSPLSVGGKTGTGDNRYERFGSGGGLLSSRAVDRTATFVFYIGDRFFGTATAYVAGEEADKFQFTSGLAVQLVKVLEPELRPLIDERAKQQALVGSTHPDRTAALPPHTAGAGQ